VETVEGTSGSTAAGVSLPLRTLNTKRQRDKLIAEVRIKLVSLAQRAQEQLAAERARAPATVIDVEKPEMDINRKKFVDKGPRDHKAFCEQVINQTRSAAGFQRLGGRYWLAGQVHLGERPG
jgi:hypothetical protein